MNRVSRNSISLAESTSEDQNHQGQDPRVGQAVDVAHMASDILDVTRKLSTELHDDLAVWVGPAITGVIGTRKLFYDVWGDAMNTGFRMELRGWDGRKQVTGAAKRRPQRRCEFVSTAAIAGVAARRARFRGHVFTFCSRSHDALHCPAGSAASAHGPLRPCFERLRSYSRMSRAAHDGSAGFLA